MKNNNIKRYVKYLYGGVGEVITKLFTTFLTIYLAKYLSKSDYGTFIYSFTLCNIGWIFVDIGLGIYGIRQISCATNIYEKQKIVNSILTVRIITSLIVSLFIILFFSIGNRTEYYYILPFISVIFIKSLTADWYLKGEERYICLYNIYVASSLITLVTVFLLLSMNKYQYIAFPWVVNALCVNIATYYQCYKDSVKIKLLKIKLSDFLSLLGKTIHIPFSNGVSNIYQSLPLLILPYFVSDNIYGEFALAYRFVVAFLFLVAIMPGLLFPRTTKYAQYHEIGKIKKLIIIMNIMIFGLLCSILLIIYLINSNIKLLPFNLEYIESIRYFNYMVVYLCIRSFRVVNVRLFLSFKKEKIYSNIIVIGLISEIVLILYMLKFTSVNIVLSFVISLTIVELFIYMVTLFILKKSIII